MVAAPTALLPSSSWLCSFTLKPRVFSAQLPYHLLRSPWRCPNWARFLAPLTEPGPIEVLKRMTLPSALTRTEDL